MFEQKLQPFILFDNDKTELNTNKMTSFIFGRLIFSSHAQSRRLILPFFQKNRKAGGKLSHFFKKITKLVANFRIFSKKQKSWPRIFAFFRKNNKAGRRFSHFFKKITKLVANFRIFHKKQKSWRLNFIPTGRLKRLAGQ